MELNCPLNVIKLPIMFQQLNQFNYSTIVSRSYYEVTRTYWSTSFLLGRKLTDRLGRTFVSWEADPVSYTVRPLLVEIMFRLVGT